MNTKNILEANELVEIVRNLTPLQRKLLTNLHDRGPGLMLEVAVRVLKFPEDVNMPLRDLSTKGLVKTEAITGGQLGNEIFSLSEQGRQAVELLRDETLQKHLEAAPMRSAPAQAAPPDPRQQEVDLLRKLGELAAQAGDLEKAQSWYEQALQATRGMTDTAATPGT